MGFWPGYAIQKKLRVEKKKDTTRRMKYWEIIADNLKKRGWSLGYVSAIDSKGRNVVQSR
jgi:hypothetical protein